MAKQVDLLDWFGGKGGINAKACEPSTLERLRM